LTERSQNKRENTLLVPSIGPFALSRHFT